MSEYLKRLKELRLTKGISQKEIAEYLGITAAAYSLYERGNREPKIAILRKIAEYYNVSVDDLLEMNSTPAIPAVHFNGSGFTEEEMKEILQFAEFIKSKRSEKPVVEYSIRQDICNSGTDIYLQKDPQQP